MASAREPRDSLVADGFILLGGPREGGRDVLHMSLHRQQKRFVSGSLRTTGAVRVVFQPQQGRALATFRIPREI